jgi:uncharacterized protein (TIGR03643 family)
MNKDTYTRDIYCEYSGLPSPNFYTEAAEERKDKDFSLQDIDRIIEMAWEDRTPFDAIKFQFDLSEADVKALMKKNLKLSSYKLWRKRVESCNTKHAKTRSVDIDRFKCNLQRNISNNKISKR